MRDLCTWLKVPPHHQSLRPIFFFSFFFSCTNMFVRGSAALWGPKHTFNAQGEGVAMTSAHFEVFRFPDKFIPSFFCDRFNFTHRV